MKSEREISDALVRYIQDEFLRGGEGVVLDESTPLLEQGILDSMRAMLLLTFIRDELSIGVSPAEVDPWALRDIRSITEMICSLSTPEAVR